MPNHPVFTAANIGKIFVCIILLVSPLLIRYAFRCVSTDPFAITAGIDRELSLAGDSVRWCFYPQSSQLLRAALSKTPAADSSEAAFFSVFVSSNEEPTIEELSADASRIFIIVSLMCGVSAIAVFLIAQLLRCSFLYSLSAAILYLVSPAYIAAAGADFSKSFFFMFFFSLLCLALTAVYRSRGHWGAIVPAAYLFYAALSSWTGASILFSVLLLWELWRILNFYSFSPLRKRLYLSFGLAFLLALCLPFCPEQKELLYSPLLVLIPVLFCAFLMKRCGKILVRVIVVLMIIAASSLWGKTSFASNSFAGESTRLMIQKFKTTNLKPGRPDRISPEARILWNGDMNSIEVATYKTHFPAAMSLFLILFAALPAFSVFWREQRRILSHFSHLFFALFSSLILYCFFNVYAGAVSFLLAIALPVFLAGMGRTKDFIRPHLFRYLAGGIILLALACEAWGGLRIRYPELSSYRNLYACGQLLLNSPYKSSLVAADAPLASIMKNSFGLRVADVFSSQARYDFIETVFSSSEVELNKRFLEKNISLLIMNRRSFFEFAKNTPRYIASVTKIPAGSLADLLSTSRESELAWFVKLELPAQYAFLDKGYIFLRVLSPADRIKAIRKEAEAEAAFAAGDKNTAASVIKEAVSLYPHIMRKSTLFYKLYGKYPITTINGIE